MEFIGVGIVIWQLCACQTERDQRIGDGTPVSFAVDKIGIIAIDGTMGTFLSPFVNIFKVKLLA